MPTTTDSIQPFTIRGVCSGVGPNSVPRITTMHVWQPRPDTEPYLWHDHCDNCGVDMHTVVSSGEDVRDKISPLVENKHGERVRLWRLLDEPGTQPPIVNTLGSIPMVASVTVSGEEWVLAE